MNIGIVGAGTMGRGIAVACLSSSHTVVLVDVQQKALENAATSIRSTLQGAVDRGKLPADVVDFAGSALTTSTNVSALSSCEIVIEAIAERLDIKNALFQELEPLVAPSCIIATNTSSISITALARVLRDPTRFVGLHFFNPANIMKLVEVIEGRRTRPDVVLACVEFAKGLGKTPVVARDVPGFIVNRVARNFYNESQRIVMEGAATIEQVDRHMKSLGFRMGPFELMDLIGVDVNLDVTTSQWEQFYLEPRFQPSLLQRQYVDGGLHGKKTGRGFYDYES
ncbi:MAG TPA: 3-hydroxybutyryl-CoA dehydrogenase [Bacteroidetes bacterium]|nr:3-hydroxybutyryl-CoA dehydrogenase [Bacteroidota bacterium]HRK04490.1 3-hydroxyacyl-CoA dehydrogenase NAD-binding domain-containing protein [Chlorobiota bacterium]